MSPSVTSTQVPADDSSPAELPLSARIERTRLRIRISALERALERSDRRQQLIVDRYERLLADRDGSSDDSSPTETGSRTVLGRLLELRP